MKLRCSRLLQYSGARDAQQSWNAIQKHRGSNTWTDGHCRKKVSREAQLVPLQFTRPGAAFKRAFIATYETRLQPVARQRESRIRTADARDRWHPASVLWLDSHCNFSDNWARFEFPVNRRTRALRLRESQRSALCARKSISGNQQSDRQGSDAILKINFPDFKTVSRHFLDFFQT